MGGKHARRWRGRLKTPAVATLMAAAFLGLSSSCTATAGGGIREREMEASLDRTSPNDRIEPSRLRRRAEEVSPQATVSASTPFTFTDSLIDSLAPLPGNQDDQDHDKRRQLQQSPELQVNPLQRYNMPKAPGPLSLAHDKKNLYTLTGESLVGFKVTQSGGKLDQIQELRDGVVDKYGTTVKYFTGLTALTTSPDGQNVYTVGTSVMPGVGGITVLNRDQGSGELSIAQQFKIDQRAGISDIDGMIGANSVAVSPNGKYAYVSSGGYYRDHNLLVFTRGTGGKLELIQNIDVYNTSASRVLPSTLLVAPDGKSVYVVGDNFAISTSAILVYSVDPATGQLTQVQEAGPFRTTLLTSASFDPSGQYLYATASYGNNLVWIFKREDDGLLTTVVDPVLAGGRQTGSPSSGSYSSALAVDAPPLGALLFVAVEKDSVIYLAQRSGGDNGRLMYYQTTLGVPPSTSGDNSTSSSNVPLKRPVSLAYDTEVNILYVSEAGDSAISSYRLKTA